MCLCLLPLLTACGRLEQVGRAPDFTPLEGSYQHHAMYSTPMPETAPRNGPTDASSLWTAGSSSLFGDRRAARTGDILTVVIEINDSAEMKNASGSQPIRVGQDGGAHRCLACRNRSIPDLPDGATMDDAVNTSSSSSYKGDGSVKRNEKLTLRVAATVVEQLPNGVLRIEGQQEVRVNFEMRVLLVTGYVRPIDISRQNEITYDKIAGAHISYGGRGQITDVQQPRYGQQVADVLLPF